MYPRISTGEGLTFSNPAGSDGSPAGRGPPSPVPSVETTVRVHIAEALRVPPAVALPPGVAADAAPAPAAPALDFSFERDLLRRLEAEERRGAGGGGAAAPCRDPYDELLERLGREGPTAGHSREELAMALAALGGEPAPAPAAAAARAYRELRAMGFGGARAAGALALHRGDAAAAADACLAAGAGSLAL